jgi:exo-beta-1,3-glucanase (GH17 family)
MNVQTFYPACVTIPMIVLSLSGCSRQQVAPAGSGEASLDVRPLRLDDDDDRWLGNAVCYGPHRDGQRPGGPLPDAAEIREDLTLMWPHWQLLRIYGAREIARPLLEQIRASGLEMKVMLGVWIAAEERRDGQGNVLARDAAAVAANRLEADAAITLAREYPEIVVAVCVGNETQVSWSPFPSPLDILIGYVRQIRAAVAVPVTTADDYQYWNRSESLALAREVDFITVHIHPLWNGQQLDNALPWFREQLAAVRAVHPDRQVVIGETGWATAAAKTGEQGRLIKGTPGEAQQAVFYDAVRAWAASERVVTFVFEAFDENWKGGDHPDEVEKHWGLFRADRTAKAALGGDPRR